MRVKLPYRLYQIRGQNDSTDIFVLATSKRAISQDHSVVCVDSTPEISNILQALDKINESDIDSKMKAYITALLMKQINLLKRGD